MVHLGLQRTAFPLFFAHLCASFFVVPAGCETLHRCAGRQQVEVTAEF